MAISSVFPETIMFDGAQWRLVYDPSCVDTVMPNINGASVNLTMDTVRYPGRATPVWLVVARILIPSAMDGYGKIIGSRRMIGFRTFDQQPVPGYKPQPNELVYYAAAQSDGSSAQQFFNAIANVQTVASESAEKPDTSWINQFAQSREDTNENA